MKETKKIDMKFIRTDDLEAAEKLRTLGFTELTETGATGYCFINDGKLTFDLMENNCYYTNVLCL